MKVDYESNKSLRLAVRCLPALAVVPSSDITYDFLVSADNMPDHKKMLLMFSDFEHEHLLGRRRPGRGNVIIQQSYQKKLKATFETALKGEGGTKNTVQG